MDKGEFEQHTQSQNAITIQLVLKEQTQLPEGFIWEEEGREFSFQGMFYDIISIKKTNKGWELTAAADEEEAIMVAKQSNDNKGLAHCNLSTIQLVFIEPTNYQIKSFPLASKSHVDTYQLWCSNNFLLIFSPPPETV